MRRARDCRVSHRQYSRGKQRPSFAAEARQRVRGLAKREKSGTSSGAGGGPLFHAVSRRRGRRGGIQDPAARFALDNLVVLRIADLLVGVRKNSHAAAAALFIQSFGKRDTVMAFGDANVAANDFFGDLRGELFAVN